MKCDVEIREQIEKITSRYKQLLDHKLYDFTTHEFLAISQVTVNAQLSALYWVLNEVKPHFNCDSH